MSKRKRKAEKHGQAGTPLYYRWQAMLKRCYVENNPLYKFYGAKGVKVCKRWRESFKAYAADVGQPPFPGAHLSRIDAMGDYRPGNVKWMTNVENLKTSRSVRRITTASGVVTLPEAAEMFGKNDNAIRLRLKRGMKASHALLAGKNLQRQIAGKYPNAPELTLKTIRALAKEASVPYAQLHRRIASGMTLADAIHDIRNSRYGEIRRAAKRLGITPTAISVRIMRGMSFEQATSTPDMRKAA